MTKIFRITPESNSEIWAMLQPPELTPDELLALGASLAMAYRKKSEAEKIECKNNSSQPNTLKK